MNLTQDKRSHPNRRKSLSLLGLILAASLLFTACGSKSYEAPFDAATTKSAFRFETANSAETAATFASNLAVVSGDILSQAEIESGEDSYGAAIFVDTNGHNAMYARNVMSQLYPASMTKVMTALVALQNGTLDQIVTADEDCVMYENDVQKIELRAGDSMTLDQALHILLIYSANDVAAMIAKNIGGSIEGFADMMNEEAKKIGATNSHFVNPHGLQDENHYTTCYDMYLIFNAACQYEDFKQIIAMNSYSATYQDANGNPKTFSCDNTNRFLREDSSVKAPTNVTAVGGKTGTTLAAGGCLVMLSRDSRGNSYISCVMKGRSIDMTYNKTKALLSLASGE
ncbi:MAG: D-alanyl-D-alanine carboxypeptidase [Lachnospiraceae bacterium]|nr:D-alanyl-D-alanine carboxypeptidase [Lachnospiraceae bacterium]